MMVDLAALLRGWGKVNHRFLTDAVAKRKANRHGAEYPSPVESVFAAEFPTV